MLFHSLVELDYLLSVCLGQIVAHAFTRATTDPKCSPAMCGSLLLCFYIELRTVDTVQNNQQSNVIIFSLHFMNHNYTAETIRRAFRRNPD